MRAGKIVPLADEYVTVYKSPAPSTLFAYSPGIAVSPNGRIIATFDLGGFGVNDLPGPKAGAPGGSRFQGKVYSSDDGGGTWTHRTDFPFMHARPFYAGGSLYLLGHNHDLTVIRSDDGGDSWSDPARLTDGEHWHQAPCNVWTANGCVYLVMEKRTRHTIRGWHVGDLAPVLMRGRLGDDLTERDNWTFASEMPFYDVITPNELDYFGVPFYECDPVSGVMVAPNRHCAPMGWLESNVVQFNDRNHIWHDPEGKTFHLWMRAHTGGTGLAAIMKVVETGAHPGTGDMITQVETVPSGKKIVYVLCPGGQMKFHVLYDPASGLFWLLSTQATDSMTRADRLPPTRYNLPNNERRRLQLHFSKNMIDWCFAGIVAIGETETSSRHYASMAMAGNDLLILSRSGDTKANTPHDGNIISFHVIRDFRNLAY